MTRAAIYCRISRDDKDDPGLGVARQEKDCRKLCADRGWTVIEPLYVDNDIGASKGQHRAQWKKMVADLEAGQVDAVVVYHQSRLSRYPLELEQFYKTCEEAGVSELAVVSGGPVPVDGAGSLFVARINAAKDAEDARLTGERVKRKKLELAQAGKPSGGGRPFGYEADGLTVREPEAALIRAAANSILAGASVRSIREQWRADDGETVTQERYRLTGKGTPGRWSTTAVRSLLMSPRNAGLRQHQGEIIGDAIWPAILERETWEQLCAVLSDPSRRPAPASHKYPLKGILRCADCDLPLSGTPRIKVGVSVAHYGCRKETGGCGPSSRPEPSSATSSPWCCGWPTPPPCGTSSPPERQASPTRHGSWWLRTPPMRRCWPSSPTTTPTES